MIRIACTSSAAGSPGVLVLTLSFGVPITNNTTYPTAATGIRVANGSGDFVTAGATQNVGISSVSNSAGTITIGIGTPAASSTVTPSTSVAFSGVGTTSTFDIAGVLVSVCGEGTSVTSACPLTPTSVTATLVAGPAGSASTGTIGANGNVLAIPAGGSAASAFSGGTSATVITSVAAGIANPGLASVGALPAGVVFPATVCTGTTGAAGCQGGPATLLSSGTATHSSFVLKVTEGFAGEFKPPTQFNGGGAGVVPTGSQGVEVWIKLSNVPSGFSIANCTGVVTTDATGATADATIGTAISQLNSAGQIKVAFTGTRSAGSLATQETLWVGCSVGVGTATPPLSTAITAQVEIGPIAGSALTSLHAVQSGLGIGNVPRYEDILTPATAFPVVIFPPSQTTLLVPFAVVAPGINTGIAVANTSTDIFGAANGGATPTAGTITFTMYPQAGGAALTFTTASIVSGGTYANNLSGILPSGTTSFTGYIFITANFPAAHGSATIYDATTGHAELSAPVLVVGTATGGNITAINPRPSPESLGQ